MTTPSRHAGDGPAVRGGDCLALAARREEILAHPRFAQARQIHVRLKEQTNLRSEYPGKLKPNVRRTMLVGLILTADAAADEGDPSTWPTLGRLKAAMSGVDMKGARRIEQLVPRLVHTGHVRLDTQSGDRRVRRVRPLPPLHLWYLNWARAYFEPLQDMFPDPGFDRMRDADTSFLKAFLRSAGSNLDLSHWVLRENAEFSAFLRHDCAYFGLNALRRLQEARADPLVRETELTTELKAHGVSRSHLHNMLMLAQEKGYVSRSGSRLQFWTVTPCGTSASDRFLADSLVTSEVNYRQAVIASRRGEC